LVDKIWKDYKQEIQDSYTCHDCNKHCAVYMLKDKIWRSIWPTYTKDMQAIKDENLRHCRLCFRCAEKRLGRKFIVDDFMDRPVNDIIFYFLKE